MVALQTFGFFWYYFKRKVLTLYLAHLKRSYIVRCYVFYLKGNRKRGIRRIVCSDYKAGRQSVVFCATPEMKRKRKRRFKTI